MIRLVLNTSRKQHPIKLQLYGLLPLISKTIQIRQTRHARPSWRSMDQLISDVLPRAPSHGHTSICWPTRTYLQQFCTDTGCCLEDLPETMNDRDERLAARHHDDKNAKRKTVVLKTLTTNYFSLSWDRTIFDTNIFLKLGISSFNCDHVSLQRYVEYTLIFQSLSLQRLKTVNYKKFNFIYIWNNLN